MTENVVNAFSCVSKVYEETSFLFKDFANILTESGFEKIREGNEIGTHDVSANINKPKYWLPRYVSSFFKPSFQKDNRHILGLSACFFDLTPNAIPPILLVGIAQGMDHPEQNWAYWWFQRAYFNKEDVFQYFLVKDEINTSQASQPQLRDWVYFKTVFTNESYQWPKNGFLFGVPLLEIKDYKEIESLVRRVVALWIKNYGQI
jgi:hypothetical protein